MAHEVIKRVGGRSYRYRVESYRDPSSGKVRGRWTYVGRVLDGETRAPRRPARERTRDRLIEALERLLERRDYAAVTAGEVAGEAGLAHGTFYRHFRDKHAALREAVDRVREAAEQQRGSLETAIGTRDEERLRVRSWVLAVLDAPVERPGLLRAWFALTDADPQVAELRAQRRAASIAALEGYIERCMAAGIVTLERPRAVATALLSLFDGVFRNVAAGRLPDEDALEGVLAVFDRTIFGA